MIKEFQVLKYRQNNQDFLSLVLPFSVLESISDVLIYGIHEGGYQRKPNAIHLNRIKKYALEHKENFVLPTSIILGITKEEVEPLLVEKSGVDTIKLDSTKKIFRIVDGQHRIAGLKEASKTNSEILNFPINVIIIISDEHRRSVELEVFTDINSKGKRINTDLARLAKYDYEIKEKDLSEGEINTHIGIKVAYYLKETDNGNVWHNAVKFDIHSDITIGIIGITIFSQSIKTIIDRYILDNPYATEKGGILKGQRLIDYCEDAKIFIGEFLYRIWNEVVKTKWPSCFSEDIIKNDEGDLVKIFYNKDYYIQKGLGVKSLNQIVGDQVKALGINDNAYFKIKEDIDNSKVKIEDWRNGGPFAGFNSESGFNKIKQIILNTLPVPL